MYTVVYDEEVDMMWQPIETARRNTDTVLLWHGGYFYSVGHWLWDDDLGYPEFTDGRNVIRPTHWMPLPAPPGDAS